MLKGVNQGKDYEAHKTQDHYPGVHVQVVDPHPGVHNKVAHPVFGTEGFGEEQDRNGCTQGQAGGGQHIGKRGGDYYLGKHLYPAGAQGLKGAKGFGGDGLHCVA